MKYNVFILLFAVCYSIIFIIGSFILRKTRWEKYLKITSIVYKGYDLSSIRGILKGGIWAFVDGIITGVVLAFVWRFLL